MYYVGTKNYNVDRKWKTYAIVSKKKKRSKLRYLSLAILLAFLMCILLYHQSIQYYNNIRVPNAGIGIKLYGRYNIRVVAEEKIVFFEIQLLI